jgi:hypothetical protein
MDSYADRYNTRLAGVHIPSNGLWARQPIFDKDMRVGHWGLNIAMAQQLRIGEGTVGKQNGEHIEGRS